jgi:hypothetical protein
MVEFANTYWFWLGGILLLFLPVELWAAKKTPMKSDTFSEFIWWAFGVKTRRSRLPGAGHGARRRPRRVLGLECDPDICSCGPLRVKWARARRVILAGLCLSLTAHFVFGCSVIPVVIFGAGAGLVMLYAVLFER